jgi:acetyl esterase/lipase
VDFYTDIAPIYEGFKDRGLTLAAKILPAATVEGVKIAYLKEGQDLKDPRLSPRFADKRILPPKIITVGCEWDVLCESAEQWMKEMAGGGVEGNRWEKGDLKWICIENEDHGKSLVPLLRTIIHSKIRELILIFGKPLTMA